MKINKLQNCDWLPQAVFSSYGQLLSHPVVGFLLRRCEKILCTTTKMNRRYPMGRKVHLEISSLLKRHTFCLFRYTGFMDKFILHWMGIDKWDLGHLFCYFFFCNIRLTDQIFPSASENSISRRFRLYISSYSTHDTGCDFPKTDPPPYSSCDWLSRDVFWLSISNHDSDWPYLAYNTS